MDGTLDLNHRESGRRLSKFFKALSDETRREILRLLEEGPRTVGEIVGNFELSQPTISRHLSVLKEAELVRDQRQGQRVLYSLRDGALARQAATFFGSFRQCRASSSFVRPEVAERSNLRVAPGDARERSSSHFAAEV